MGLFSSLSGFLEKAIGNNLDNNPADIRNTKRGLSQLGFFNNTDENDYITRDLDTGIRSFQRYNNLRVDGRLFPGGETEQSLIQKIKAKAGRPSSAIMEKQRRPSSAFERDLPEGVGLTYAYDSDEKPILGNKLATGRGASLKTLEGLGDAYDRGGFEDGSEIDPDEGLDPDPVDDDSDTDEGTYTDAESDNEEDDFAPVISSDEGSIAKPILTKINKDEIFRRIAVQQAINDKGLHKTGRLPERKPGSLKDKPVEYDATGRMIMPETTMKDVPLPGRKPLGSAFRPSILKGRDNKDIKSLISKAEGRKTFLYKDTADNGGRVTIGVGVMLPDVEAAKKLPFTLPDGKGGRRLATALEIESSFKKVEAIGNRKKLSADAFAPNIGSQARKNNLDDLQISESVVDKLLDERLRADANHLRQVFAEFDTFPPEAQKELLDMQFNLGSTKFRESRIVGGVEKGWPKLFAAVKAKDWAKVAKQSKRGGIGSKRNQKTFDGFMKAYRERKRTE